MVPDSTRGKFNTVADNIILVSQDIQRILGIKRLQPPCGMEKGLWVNSIFPVSSSISYIGKSLT